MLTSTRVNAFDRSATAEVSMLGIGARLTLAFWRQAICEMADPTRTEVTRTRTVMTVIINPAGPPGGPEDGLQHPATGQTLAGSRVDDTNQNNSRRKNIGVCSQVGFTLYPLWPGGRCIQQCYLK